MKQLPMGATAWLWFCLTWISCANASPVLVDIDWTRNKLQDPAVVLVDMSDELQYRRFHLPGAIHIDYEDLVMMRKDKVSVRIPDAEFYTRLGNWGIKSTDYIVIYDDIGGLNAGRLFWQLQRIGHASVSVVNGGLVQWILAGYPVENRLHKRPPETYQPTHKITNNEMDIDAVQQASREGTLPILDVRTQEEYVGNPKYKRTGHIPNARWWPWDGTIEPESGFVHRTSAKLEESLKKAGVIDKSKPVLLYCQSGHRAAQAYLTLKYLGYAEPKIYDGSIAEYRQNPASSFVIGPEP